MTSSHLTNVLKHKTKSLEHTVLDVKLGDTILVHQGRQYSKGSTSFGNNCNGNSGTNTHLPVLYFQIVQQSMQDILRTYCFRNVTKSADGGSTDCFLVSLKQLQKFEADAHPFFGGYKFCTPVCNSTHLK